MAIQRRQRFISRNLKMFCKPLGKKLQRSSKRAGNFTLVKQKLDACRKNLLQRVGKITPVCLWGITPYFHRLCARIFQRHTGSSTVPLCKKHLPLLGKRMSKIQRRVRGLQEIDRARCVSCSILQVPCASCRG
jgi:hypothetical protein